MPSWKKAWRSCQTSSGSRWRSARRESCSTSAPSGIRVGAASSATPAPGAASSAGQVPSGGGSPAAEEASAAPAEQRGEPARAGGRAGGIGSPGGSPRFYRTLVAREVPVARRSIGFPLTVGVVLLLLVLALAVGWQILLVSDVRRASRGALEPRLGAAGRGRHLLPARDRGAGVAVRLAGARDAHEPAPAGVPGRRDPRDEDTARFAAALPRHAGASRPGAASIAGSSSRGCTRTSSASTAPSSRC